MNDAPRSPAATAARDPPEAGSSHDGRAERNAASASTDLSEDDLPSPRPMGWIVLTGEISVATVLTFLLAPSLLDDPSGRFVEPLTKFLPSAVAQPAAPFAPARRESAAHPSLEHSPPAVPSADVATTSAVTHRESAGVPAPSLPPIETVRLDVPFAGKEQSPPAVPENDEAIWEAIAPEAVTSESPAPEPPWVVASGPSGAASLVPTTPVDPAAAPAPPISAVTSQPDAATASVAGDRSDGSSLEAEEASAPDDAPTSPALPLTSELPPVPDPPTVSALTGLSPNSPDGGSDALMEPFSPSVMKAAEMAEALAAERKQAFEREMERADSLAHELAQIREELSALRSRSQHGTTSFPALPHPLLPRADPAPPAAPQDGNVVQPFSQQPESAAQPIAVAAEVRTRPETPPASSATPAVAQAAPPVPAAVQSTPVSPQQPATPAVSGHQRLLDRAAALIKAHDISGARLVLERVVSEGSIEATYLLAQTYDPRMLKLWAVVGLPGDAARAEELYARARAAGVRAPPESLVRN